MNIVLNLGLKSIRCVLFDSSGSIVSVKSLPLTTYVSDNQVEQDPNEWWEKGCEVIHQCLDTVTLRPEVESITVTASSCCLVPVDSEGRALRRAIMVSDTRAAPESSFLESSAEYKVHRRSNNIIATDPTLMLPKALWLKNNQEGIYQQSQYLLSPNDYFCFRLTGRPVVDELNAEKFFYSRNLKKYPASLFEEVGVDVSKLPTVANVGERVGELTPVAQASLGLNSGVQFVISTYDAICAFLGSGPVRSGEACDVSGTVTSLRVLCDLNVTSSSDSLFKQTVPNMQFGVIGGSNNLGGGLIEWAKQTYLPDVKDPYGVMESDAESIAPGASGLLFLPYLMGERAPLWNKSARGVFFGIGRHHRRPHFLRAVFEGAAFSVKSLVDEVEQSYSISQLRVSGGLARINLVNQIKADVLCKKVLVLDEFETTAIGANMIVEFSGNGMSKWKELSTKVKVRQVIIPNEQNHEIYLEKYKLFRSVYQSLEGCFAELASIKNASETVVAESIENM